MEVESPSPPTNSTTFIDLPAELRQKILNLLIPPWAFRRYITSRIVNQADKEPITWSIKEPIHALPVPSPHYETFEAEQISQITILTQVCRRVKNDMKVLRHIDPDDKVARHAPIDLVMFEAMLDDPTTNWPETLVLDLFYHDKAASRAQQVPGDRGEWDDVCGIDVLDKQTRVLSLALNFGHLFWCSTGDLVGWPRERVEAWAPLLTKAIHVHMKRWIEAASKNVDRSRTVIMLVDFGETAFCAGWHNQLRWRDIYRLMKSLQRGSGEDGIRRRVQLVGEQPQRLVEMIDTGGADTALWDALGEMKRYWSDRGHRVEEYR